MKSIYIKTHRVEKCKNEVVRLQSDARKIVTRLQRESGMNASFIVSEIVRQAAEYVEFKEEEE